LAAAAATTAARESEICEKLLGGFASAQFSTAEESTEHQQRCARQNAAWIWCGHGEIGLLERYVDDIRNPGASSKPPAAQGEKRKASRIRFVAGARVITLSATYLACDRPKTFGGAVV